MRSFFLLSAAIVFVLTCPAQSTDKAPLRFRSYAFGLCVNKNEQLVVATRIGEVAIASSVQSYWRRVDPVKTAKDGLTFGITLDQANFFNNDTGFVSGFVNEGRGAYDIIYHTSDGGNSWKKI